MRTSLGRSQTKIESLTDAQSAALVPWAERWIKIGLSTEPINERMAVLSMRRAYKRAGLVPPRYYVTARCPLSLALCDSYIMAICHSVGASVGASVWDSVGDSVGASVGDSLNSFWMLYWLAFYLFFLAHCGLKAPRSLDGLAGLVSHSGWWIARKGLFIISDRPRVIARDAAGRLHRDDGPCVLYPSGWGFHAWHGTRVPAHVIESPHKLTPLIIDSEQNAEVRRVMIERFGTSKYLVEGGAKKIHSDDYGTLYLKQRQDDSDLLMVKVVNATAEPDGTYKDYFLRVPPTVKTAREAVAWTFSKEGHEYAPEIQT